MGRFVLWTALAACVLSTGCASVTGGNTQKMYVQAQTLDGTPVTGADCSLSNDKGTWRVKAPGDTSITRSNKRMEVKCGKSPLPEGVVSVESSTRAAMFGNILIGGAIGAVIDHSSGAAYEYPEMIKVVMGRMISMNQPRGATPAATGEAMKNAKLRDEKGIAAAPGATQPAAMASGYARVEDADAVPYLSDKGRESYREWVGRPMPKAFAVSAGGQWFGAWSTHPGEPSHPTDPTERAMYVCQQRAKGPCELYAVNGSVVWSKPVAAVLPPAPAVVAVPAIAPQPAATPATAVPIASGYAPIDDIDAIPYLSDRGRDAYREWLNRPTPKAFAISAKGHWFTAWSLTPQDTTLPSDPTERALVGCQRAAQMPCKLYAINRSVVWGKDPR